MGWLVASSVNLLAFFPLWLNIISLIAIKGTWERKRSLVSTSYSCFSTNSKSGSQIDTCNCWVLLQYMLNDLSRLSRLSAGDDEPAKLISTVVFAATVWFFFVFVCSGVHLLLAVNETNRGGGAQVHRLRTLKTFRFDSTWKDQKDIFSHLRFSLLKHTDGCKTLKL